MILILKKEVVEQHKEKVEALKNRHQEMVKEDNDHSQRQSQLNTEIKEAEDLIRKHGQERTNLNHKRQLITRESQLNHRQRIELEELLAADKFEKELLTETAKQQDFFEALSPIIEVAIKDCFEGLEGFETDVDIDVAVKEIKGFMERGGWSQDVSTANTYKAQYDAAVRSL